MSPELVSYGSPVNQRAISSPSTQSALTKVWLSPSAALNRVYPSVMQRSMQASATSRWIVVNSKDSALTACVSPCSASCSKPSTSILMKAGAPYLPISASSVVTGTGTALIQRRLYQPRAPLDQSDAAAVDAAGCANLQK